MLSRDKRDKNFLTMRLSFSNAQSAYYKIFMANAMTSALRLHQRMPRIAFTREYLSLLLMEDSCHYLFFSLIYLYVAPVLLIPIPIVLFAILHSASYSLTLLDVSFISIIYKMYNRMIALFIYRLLDKIHGGALDF